MSPPVNHSLDAGGKRGSRSGPISERRDQHRMYDVPAFRGRKKKKRNHPRIQPDRVYKSRFLGYRLVFMFGFSLKAKRKEEDSHHMLHVWEGRMFPSDLKRILEG